MHLLFLDESGTPDEGIFALGGVIVRADDWPEIRSRWDLCMEQCGWPGRDEFKWSGTQRSKAASDAAGQVYNCLAGLPLRCLVTVLYTEVGGPDLKEKFFATPDDVYETAFTFVAERFQRFLVTEDSHGVIVLDSRRYAEDDHMRRFFDRIHSEGTEFAELDRIVDGLMLGPSHYSLGLQLADLIVGPTRASRFKTGDASRFFNLLEPRFLKNPNTGKLNGVGLKVFPGARDEDDRLFEPG